MSSGLAVKGVGDGLLVLVPEGPWEEALASLLQTVDEGGEFFKGARLALQIEGREIGAADLGHLRDLLAGRNVSLWAILGTSQLTRSAAADLGLALDLGRPSQRAREEDEPIETELPGEHAALVHRTLRSGHHIHYAGHVVVVGDVNPGAEIIAGGDVIVWGRLRGVVHAGAGGNEEAVVCALDLAPTQLRIAGQIAISPDRRGTAQPEMARLKDGQLVAEKWVDEHRRKADEHGSTG
jgi:septum site-determining protein MinC